MVAKVIALYKQPKDTAAFEDKYFNEHMPIAQKIPGLQLIEISRVTGAPDGAPAYYMMVELYFDDMAAVKAGMESNEGKAAKKHAESIAGDLLTLLFAEVRDKN